MRGEHGSGGGTRASPARPLHGWQLAAHSALQHPAGAGLGRPPGPPRDGETRDSRRPWLALGALPAASGGQRLQPGSVSGPWNPAGMRQPRPGPGYLGGGWAKWGPASPGDQWEGPWKLDLVGLFSEGGPG